MPQLNLSTKQILVILDQCGYLIYGDEYENVEEYNRKTFTHNEFDEELEKGINKLKKSINFRKQGKNFESCNIGEK
jgi:hypothetical protein